MTSANCWVLAGESARHRHPGSADLGQPGLDQFRLDGLGVELLQTAGGGHLVGGFGELFIGRGRVLVAGPQALQVEHSQPTQASHLDGGGGRHHRVHGSGDNGGIKGDGVDAPPEVHLRFGAGAPRGSDGDIVERVPAGGVLGAAKFVHRFPVSVTSSWVPQR